MLDLGKRFIVLLMLFVLAMPAAMIAGNVNYNVPMYHDWWWEAPEQPVVKVNIANNGKENCKCEVSLNVTTDKYAYMASMSQQVYVAAGDSTVVAFSLDLAPGFYRCTVTGDGEEVKKFNIGYEPESIVSLPDAQPDFDEFWQQTLNELAQVAPEFSMAEEKDKSNKGGKVYLVKMKSLGGVEVQGYLTMPAKASKKNTMPVLVHYMGYGSKPWHVEPYEGMNRIEFVLSTRGQGLNEPANEYGEWALYGLGDRDQYYYRGAYMDLIRAIDFVCSLPEVDTRYIFAEGGSQGGAFTLVACSLDGRIRAAAPWIPFLNDFPDYFKIEHWPGDVLVKKQHELGLSDADLYKMLSYFDVKNFTRRITCPIMMGIGLQDPTCPPHTNFAGYNLITSQKQFVIYPECKHDTRHPDWDERQKVFFEEITKM